MKKEVRKAVIAGNWIKTLPKNVLVEIEAIAEIVR